MPQREDDLGSAARVLADAVSALTRAVGQGLTEASKDVGDQLATSLREASRDLADASAQVSRRKADQARRRAEVERTRTADRRRAKAERTRADLLDAARTVFAAKGYEGASVGDIAAEAGYTKGAVYANFDGKEDLLLQIARQLAEGDGDCLAAQAGRSPRDVFGEAVFGQTGDPGALAATLLALEVYTYAVRHPDARAELGPLVGASWERAAQLLATTRAGEGAEPSRADRDTALGVLAVLMFSQVLGPVVGPDAVAGSAARLVDRLLGDDPA